MYVGRQDLSDVRGTSPTKEFCGWAKSFKDLEAQFLQCGYVW